METPDSPPDLLSNHSFSDMPVTTPSKTGGQDRVNHGTPGSSWSSKKFREEYDRVLDGLVDKNWDSELFSGGV